MRVSITTLLLAKLLFMCTQLESFAQSVNAFAFKLKEPIVLDGILDEEIWGEEGWNDNFTQYFPYDTSAAVAQ
ncbi:MAG: hypothetical protein NXH89_05555, partial [Cyclobacteriaceae bacterium]|nr:hypothetical protein [Cyclobacteriaceae bacterium]